MYGSVKQTFSSQFYYWASLVPSYHRPSQLKVPEQYPKKNHDFLTMKKSLLYFWLILQTGGKLQALPKINCFFWCVLNTQFPSKLHIKPDRVELKSLKISNMIRAEKDSLGFSQVIGFLWILSHSLAAGINCSDQEFLWISHWHYKWLGLDTLFGLYENKVSS